jgi:hypothetical protein
MGPMKGVPFIGYIPTANCKISCWFINPVFDTHGRGASPRMESGHILFQTWRDIPRFSLRRGPFKVRVREVSLSLGAFCLPGLLPRVSRPLVKEAGNGVKRRDAPAP